MQLATGQVLRRQVGAGGDKAALNVVAGHRTHELFDVGGAHAAAQQAIDQCALVVGVQQIGAQNVDADDVVAVAFGLAGVYPGHDRFQVQARGCLLALGPLLFKFQALLGLAQQDVALLHLGSGWRGLGQG